MPKNKSDSDSDSDSGPEDTPPPAKKTKPTKPSSSKADEEEPTWTVDKNRLLKVREFRGKIYVDIREYYEANGELKPSKKGISLSAVQWRKVCEIMEEVTDVLKKKS